MAEFLKNLVFFLREAVYSSKLYHRLETMKEKDIVEFKKKLKSEEEEDLLEATNIIEDYLYKIGLTKIATRKVYDTTNPEIENIEKGL